MDLIPAILLFFWQRILRPPSLFLKPTNIKINDIDMYDDNMIINSYKINKKSFTCRKLKNPCGKSGNISNVTLLPSERSFLANMIQSSRQGSNSTV